MRTCAYVTIDVIYRCSEDDEEESSDDDAVGAKSMPVATKTPTSILKKTPGGTPSTNKTALSSAKKGVSLNEGTPADVNKVNFPQ